MQTNKSEESHEFSRKFDLTKVKSSTIDYSIQATEIECEMLKIRLNLLDLKFLKANFKIAKANHVKGFDIDGVFQAQIIQACALSAEALPISTIENTIEITYRKDLEDEEVSKLDLNSNRDILALDNWVIDLGEITTQYLSLCLPDFPKKESTESLIKLF